jgi:hypothetical protein
LPLPSQRISAGRIEKAYQGELRRLQAEKAVERLWKKDATLWGAEDSNAQLIQNGLGWIGVLEHMGAETSPLQAFAAEVWDAGLADIVLVGTGGATLAAEVFTGAFPAPEGRRFFLLDSTSPDSICALERQIELSKTLFVVASKSGKTLETISQFLYFLEKVRIAGVGPSGPHFAAITGAETFISRLGQEYGFRKVFLNADDIGGRFSALSYFGLVPAALRGVPLSEVLARAMEMREACGPGAAEPNPALHLGALLGAAESQGHDRLVLLAEPSLVPLSYWVQQLISESTGKERRGIVPVAGDVPLTPAVFEQGCVVALLSYGGNSAGAIEAPGVELATHGVPVVDIRLADACDLGAEFFKWEVATALAAAVLQVNPFDEPQEQENRERTAQLLEYLDRSGSFPSATLRLNEGGIELYAEGRTRQEISTLQLSDALRTFFDLRQREGYLALLAFLDWNEENYELLCRMRAKLAETLAVPVLLAHGPRYLHSLGQLFKGGAPTGMHVMITAEPQEDVPVPGGRYSFGQLLMAQALGDLEALQRHERQVLRLHLKEGAREGLAYLLPVVEHATASLRRKAW